MSFLLLLLLFSHIMLKAIFIAIGLVMVLYVAVSLAVFSNLSLPEIIKAQDYALAIVTIAIAIILALQYISKHIPNVGYFIAAGFVLAFMREIGFRLVTKRVISKQT